MDIAGPIVADSVPSPTSESEHLSYKFQRLRERLRQAVASGELSGRLPGERELAKLFRANPKTLSKALTDLAAEGLLERFIGRGTYVKGAPASPVGAGQWLVLADDSVDNSLLVEVVRQQNPDAEFASPTAQLRPSYLDRFHNVLDLSATTPEPLIRSLTVRGMNLVRIGFESSPVRTHSVLLDTVHAATVLARQILLAGHRHILVIEASGQQAVYNAVCLAVQRYAPSATVSTGTLVSPARVIESGATAVLCDNEPAARLLQHTAESNPQLARVSIAAVGLCAGEPCCTGIYVTPAELIATATGLINDVSLHRPTTLWLTGRMIDRSTIKAVPEPLAAAQAA